jgi:hypothetical protein
MREIDVVLTRNLHVMLTRNLHVMLFPQVKVWRMIARAVSCPSRCLSLEYFVYCMYVCMYANMYQCIYIYIYIYISYLSLRVIYIFILE